MSELMKVTAECFDNAAAFTLHSTNSEMLALLKLSIDVPLVLVEVGSGDFFLRVTERGTK